MTLLIDQTFERTLDRLLATYATPDWRGASLDAWLFEDAGQRRAAEARFRAAGVDARLHPAYKPLIGFFVEDARAAGPFARVELGYPVVPDAGENRFRLEAYPLAGMIGDARLDLVPEAVAAGAMPAYRLRLEAADGSLTDLTLPRPQPSGGRPCRPDAAVAHRLAEACPSRRPADRPAAGNRLRGPLSPRHGGDRGLGLGGRTSPSSKPWRSASICRARIPACRSAKR